MTDLEISRRAEGNRQREIANAMVCLSQASTDELETAWDFLSPAAQQRILDLYDGGRSGCTFFTHLGKLITTVFSRKARVEVATPVHAPGCTSAADAERIAANAAAAQSRGQASDGRRNPRD